MTKLSISNKSRKRTNKTKKVNRTYKKKHIKNNNKQKNKQTNKKKNNKKNVKQYKVGGSSQSIIPTNDIKNNFINDEPQKFRTIHKIQNNDYNEKLKMINNFLEDYGHHYDNLHQKIVDEQHKKEEEIRELINNFKELKTGQNGHLINYMKQQALYRSLKDELPTVIDMIGDNTNNRAIPDYFNKLEKLKKLCDDDDDALKCKALNSDELNLEALNNSSNKDDVINKLKNFFKVYDEYSEKTLDHLTDLEKQMNEMQDNVSKINTDDEEDDEEEEEDDE
jgi:hypothetical protein